MSAKIIPDVVRDQKIHSLAETGTARDAAKLMAEVHISAVLVAAGDKLLGIVTERDLTARIVAAGADPDTTPLSEIMTRNPDTLTPGATPLEALEMMRERGYRHLPLVEDGRMAGMVSIRDLYAAAKAQLEEDVRQREAFIFDTGYGAGT